MGRVVTGKLAGVGVREPRELDLFLKHDGEWANKELFEALRTLVDKDVEITITTLDGEG